MDPQYIGRLRALHAQFKIPETYAAQTGLPLYEEPDELVETELDFYGREQRLTPGAFAAWQAMQESARADGISLLMLSAYRSVDYQCQILRRKLDAGQSLEQILRVNAAPGFSEHHTGRAIDIGAPECPVLEERFEETTAFAWLQSNAANCGITYEPWHWCFSA